MRMFRRVRYSYHIGDYFPDRCWIVRAYEGVKRFYNRHVEYAYYLTDAINRQMNRGTVRNDQCHQTVMWGDANAYARGVDAFNAYFDNRSYYAQAVASWVFASEPVGRFDEAYRVRHGLGGSSTVNTALKLLQESGDVDFVEGVNRVADPLFAEFLKK